MGKEVLIIGSSQGGLQAAMDLADVGVKVHLIEPSPFMGKQIGNLFPDYLSNVHLLELLKHPNITAWTNTELQEIKEQDRNYQAVLQRYPRYIDLSKCTACGDCVEVCPITVPGKERKAIYLGGQPDCAVIEKIGISPCSNACPAGVHVQGYVALIAQGRYGEAYNLIHSALPFPSVCGRVCNHLCEEACTRSQLDDAVNIMALKRYVADWAYQNRDQLPDSIDLIENGIDQERSDTSRKKVAVIGAGPAGLTAARDLVRRGHAVTIFDDNPVAGGMMRVGIPPHRLSYDQLSWEIDGILSEGVDLQLNTWVDDIPGLLEDGYNAVLIATGAHTAEKIPIEGADHPDNWLSLDFLKQACLGDEIDLSSRKVIVLGGGDVAMDAARVAVRLDTSEVRVVCRGMRASFNEIQEAEEEGIEIIRGRVFQRIILADGGISGVECLEAEVGEVINGKRQFTEIPGTEHLIPGDLVIWALGQSPDFSFLPQDERIAVLSPQGIQADKQMGTTMEGVFTAGDVRRGTTFFVVDAVGEGHQAAHNIDLYLKGEPVSTSGKILSEVILSMEDMESRVEQRESARKTRTPIPHLPVKERENCFCEVDLPFSEQAALQEAGRCLICGPCSECLACVEVCGPGAVIHNQTGSTAALEIDLIMFADGSIPDQQNLNTYRITPDDKISGSAAAFQAMQALGVRPLPPTQSIPLVSSVGTKSNKIGLILCQCGGEISHTVDTAVLQADTLNWPGITYTQELPFSCSKEAADELMEIIHSHSLDKLILAACTCCSLDQICFSCTYQRLRCKENLGLFSSLEMVSKIEFVNIREQCAWVHQDNRDVATAAAKSIIKTSLARLHTEQKENPLLSLEPKKVLILGSGPAGQICADSLTQLRISSEKLDNIPERLERVGGQIIIHAGTVEKRADIVVFAPVNKNELRKLFASYKMPDGRSMLPKGNPQINSLDVGFILCSPDIENEASGMAAAARIAAWINRINSRISPAAQVDRSRCRACGTCVNVCGFGIPEIIGDDFGIYSRIDPQLCLGCGICAAQCPSGAITPGKTTDSQLEEMLDAILT